MMTNVVDINKLFSHMSEEEYEKLYEEKFQSGLSEAEAAEETFATECLDKSMLLDGRRVPKPNAVDDVCTILPEWMNQHKKKRMNNYKVDYVIPHIDLQLEPFVDALFNRNLSYFLSTIKVFRDVTDEDIEYIYERCDSYYEPNAATINERFPNDRDIGSKLVHLAEVKTRVDVKLSIKWLLLRLPSNTTISFGHGHSKLCNMINLSIIAALKDQKDLYDKFIPLHFIYHSDGGDDLKPVVDLNVLGYDVGVVMDNVLNEVMETDIHKLHTFDYRHNCVSVGEEYIHTSMEVIDLRVVEYNEALKMATSVDEFISEYCSLIMDDIREGIKVAYGYSVPRNTYIKFIINSIAVVCQKAAEKFYRSKSDNIDSVLIADELIEAIGKIPAEQWDYPIDIAVHNTVVCAEPDVGLKARMISKASHPSISICCGPKDIPGYVSDLADRGIELIQICPVDDEIPEGEVYNASSCSDHQRTVSED